MTVAQRIISTVPSQTELLYDLGLDEAVVGITKFCVHPQNWHKTKTRIGGTKTLDIEKIISLKPDLIIANKEENVKEQIEALAGYCEVYLSDIKTPVDNIQLIKDLGDKTGTRLSAIRLATKLRETISAISPIPKVLSAVYLIWREPYMTIGQDTYIHAIMQKCGLKNCFGNKSRYPETTIKNLIELQPNLVLLSSEPYPFKEKHIEEIKLHLPNSSFYLVDGEAFSWYGTRLIRSVGYLNNLLQTISSQDDKFFG